MTVSVFKSVVRAGQPNIGSASFTDLGNPDTPDSVDYRVDAIFFDATFSTFTSTLIRDWSPSVPASSTSVILEDEDEALTVATSLKEFHAVTFRATKGAVTLDESALYLVTNLGYQSIIVSLDCTMTPTLERYTPLPSSRISRVVELDNWNP